MGGRSLYSNMKEGERVCVCVFEVGGSGMGDNEFGLGMQRFKAC